MAVLQIRLDDELKELAVRVYSEVGMDISTAIRLFLRKSVAVGGLPFDATIDNETLKFILSIDNMSNTSKNNGNDNMTLDEINDVISDTRKGNKNKK